MTATDRRFLATMDRLNRVLPLWEPEESGLDPRIQSLIEQRSRARQARDFALADELRDRIFDMGYLVEDTRTASAGRSDRTLPATNAASQEDAALRRPFD